MPRFDFRCPDCGDRTEFHPISAVPDSSACPHCGRDSRRLVSSPNLSRADGRAMRLHDRAAATSSEPHLVRGSLPPSRRRPARVSSDPRHATLPRP